MRSTVVTAAHLISAMALSTLMGCPPPTPDAGVLLEPDAGSRVDAGPSGLEIGDGCRVDSDECRASLECLPSVQNPNVGSCRQTCGTIANGVAEKDSDVTCGESESCQIVSGPDARPTFVVCLPVTTTRDGVCLSPDDPAGCAAETIAGLIDVDPEQISCDYATSLSAPHFCKVRCIPGDDTMCPEGERCFPSENPLRDLEAPSDGNSDRIVCTPSLCGAGDPGCECGADYACEFFLSGETLCAREVGNCGVPVPTLLERQLSFENLCNGVEDHRFCDASEYDALENGAQVDCVKAFLGFPNENDGQCLALCSFPEFDYDKNGTVDDDERARSLACRPNEECRRETFGLRNVSTQPCNEEDCPAGQPCSACVGEGECLSTTAGFRCGVLIGACVVPPPVDAGPDVDAGEPDAGPLDAGADGGLIDAGPDGGLVDAGSRDAGPADAGADDAGPVDAGAPSQDAGAADAGNIDAGSTDSGVQDGG